MFKVAGVSRLNGVVKVRFANDMTRVKVLAKNGHTDVELMELPSSMDKAAVIAFLKTTELYLKPEYQAVIDGAAAKYAEDETVKVTVKPQSKKTSSSAKSVESQTEAA
jgi:hypothetical protein